MSWSGLALIAALVSPVLVGLAVMLTQPLGGRIKFRLVWAALASLPLMLPVGTPESYHLIGAVAPMAAICEAGWRRAKWLIVLVPLIAVPHLAARWQLFYKDLPLMSSLVENYRGRGELENMPIQVGGHYAFWPRTADGDCFVNPIWVGGGGRRLTDHPTGGSIPLCR